MKENYEGMEEIQEDMIPGEELLSVEGAAGTKEGVLSGEIGTEEEVSSDGIGEEEINEILGNDWTVGEALSPDSPDYQILKGKRRKKRGRRGPLREEKAEPDRQEKEEGKEAKAEDIGRTDVSEEPDKVPESGIELRFTKGRSEGRDGSREKGKRVYDRSGMRDFEESFDVGSGWKKKTSWDEKQGKQGEYREQERISQGAYRDPYERGVAREIQAEDLRSVPKDQSRVAYDSRQDRAVRNSKEQRGDDLRQDQAVGDAKAHGRRHDSGQDIERENSGETDGGIKTRRGYEAGYAAERLSNFRSWQSLYELYVFAGRQVVSGAADTVRRQQGTVSEGLKELRENRIVRFAAALGAGYGAASVYKCMRYRDKRIAETAEKVERLRIAPEVLKDREVLKKALREKKV
ncbi:MAG TPA: hypothetical protein DCL38_06875, partial [Lachnospiraceae bacterium]|nr:hypothetical protein [Lachnospiraceae bacterium]